MRALEDAVETTSKATTVEISATHTRKYNQLKGNNKASSSNLVNKDKWVNNISKRTLSPVEIAALMKGFNFAITPKEVPVSKILSSIETGIYSLSQTAKDTVRVGVTNILRTCKTPFKTNMSKEEENALKNLRKDETITILPADKGKSVVVMDSKEYKEKVSTLLVDTKTYSQLTDKRLNLTTRVEKDLTSSCSTSKSITLERHHKLVQAFIKNYTAIILHRHLSMASPKFTNLKDHSGRLQAA